MMEKARLVPVPPTTSTKRRIRRLIGLIFCALAAQTVYLCFSHDDLSSRTLPAPYASLKHREYLQAKCTALQAPAGPPTSFKAASRVRIGSDRQVPGTPAFLITNARIWTGAQNGTEIGYGDMLLHKGVIGAVGVVPPELLDSIKDEIVVLDVKGKWVTPGLVDLHSHIGVYSSPALRGASDGNSRKAPILPWLRSIDGLNTHDASYELARSGGVTTAQILPGSANNIGGQAFVIKLRDTAERSVTSKVVEPPSTLLHSANTTSEFVHWRHMKHACGENPDRLYGQTRMDAQWNFRNAYNEARKLRDTQDAFCNKVHAQDWVGLHEKFEGMDDIPEDLQWESLVDVLRGRVKLSIHCYEAVDLDGIVRLSNEFKFPVASFHHAGETYLVPDLLKKTWGGAPSIALFASNFRKKREAYRGSEFAPRILSDHGIPVVMKSDHPVVNSRYLLFEAQQAHYYGLSPSLALASVTSVPAAAAGLAHRIGSIAVGYDADVVIWDSHPLRLGATPEQVFIDGVPQLAESNAKGSQQKEKEGWANLPRVPGWEREREEVVKWEGLPPLRGRVLGKKGNGIDGASKRKVRVEGVSSLIVLQRGEGEYSGALSKDEETLKTLFDDSDKSISGGGRSVLLEDGQIICIETTVAPCELFTTSQDEVEVVDLQGGSIGPGLTTFGAPLGLVEIRLESSTNDGVVRDALAADPPKLLEGAEVVRAVDGLAFEGRNTLLAYRSGVTTAITAPVGSGFLQGLSAAFSVGAEHALARGAIQSEEVAMHVQMSFGMVGSVSTLVEVLRRLLFVEEVHENMHDHQHEVGSGWARVRKGEIPLVVSVESADIMATLLKLKAGYESETERNLKLTFAGATEAHLLANEIAAAGVSVILTSPRPYPATWEQRRILPGPPLSSETSIMVLLKAGVNVAVGSPEESSARNTRFELAWAMLDSNGTLTRHEIIALATTNLHKALGFSRPRRGKLVIPDLVMYSGGGVLDFESKVAGIISAERGIVELF